MTENATENAGTAAPDAPAPFDFATSAKKYRPRKAVVLAFQHRGEPLGYGTQHGNEIAEDGDYVVQVGEHEGTRIVLPNPITKTPGGHEKIMLPTYEIMSATDFESIYEPA